MGSKNLGRNIRLAVVAVFACLFVAGMRTHGNALEAMLLHMQDNWNELALNTDVLEAMRAGHATQPELVAAGYNSNSAKLPGYIRRGGSAWRTLIPRETQMYLQIMQSFESLLPIKPRAGKEDKVKTNAPETDVATPQR